MAQDCTRKSTHQHWLLQIRRPEQARSVFNGHATIAWWPLLSLPQCPENAPGHLSSSCDLALRLAGGEA